MATIKQAKGMGFADQLPAPDPMPGGSLNPRAAEVAKYKETFFDPKYDGFGPELEYICDLPFRPSKKVKSSSLGVGFEVLDHRTAYIFEKVMPIAKDSGIKWARVQTGWQRAETVPGVYNFDWLDEIVNGLLDAGIQPWFSLSFGNGLYMEGCEPVPPHGSYMYSPTRFGEKGINGWINYCKAMAEHFKDRVFHWEVWNEPNGGFLRKPDWRDMPDVTSWHEPPEEYVKLVKITEGALHSVQPEAKIIAGSIAGCAICNDFIQRLFDAGIAEYIDCISYHPYQGIPEPNYAERLDFIRSLIAQSGRNITIWQGENGRPSNSATLNRGLKNTEGSQARYLCRRYLTDLRQQVEVTSYFLICDIGNGYLPNGNVHSQGVIDATDPENYRPKLAFRAMQSFAYLFDSDTKPMVTNFEIQPMIGWGINTLPLDVASGITCGFRRGNIPLFAYYHPTHIDADWQIKAVRIQTWLHPSMKFDKPVLIDPITARVYQIKQMAVWSDGNWGEVLVMPKLPLLDYPLFITDATLLDELAK